MFPKITGMMPDLSNYDIAVKPMTAPIGKIFYLDYIYGPSPKKDKQKYVK